MLMILTTWLDMMTKKVRLGDTLAIKPRHLAIGVFPSIWYWVRSDFSFNSCRN